MGEQSGTIIIETSRRFLCLILANGKAMRDGIGVGPSGFAWKAPSTSAVSVFSMLVGFFFWYSGLALGGIAAVGQLQLLQPFFGLILAALLLHEHVSAAMLIVTVGIVACVAGARKFA